MTDSAPLEVHVVSHTHWDREWYQPAGRFRQRLVALVDELLDAPPSEGTSFLLDGQAIVLEDYLAVRPERRDELASLLRAGRVEAGPWYVLADELIPSGEALVRNLLAGRRAIAALGASSPPVLYCPDSFGHPAALPTIARGFGLELVVLWRGYGGRRWPAGDTVRWRGPDGAEVLVHHLPPDGYEFGSSLPVTDKGARDRWKHIHDVLAPRAVVGVAMLTHGADHHARQRDAARALDMLDSAAAGAALRRSSLTAFAERVIEVASGARLPVVRGELRDSYGYTWTLQGTFAARASQKRRNARAERLLLREAEPWAAIAAARGARSLAPLLRHAWRTLLECHPHDSLCGCSIDAVARAVDARLSDAIAQARGVRDDALLSIIAHDPVEARERPADWRSVVVLRNTVARPRRGVAEVRVARFVRDVPVGPGSARMEREHLTAARADRDALHRQQLALVDGGRPVVLQPMSSALATDLVESPRHYPDADRVVASRALVWVDDIAGYGTRSLTLADEGQRHAAVLPGDVRPVTAGADFIDNGLLRLEWSAAGAVRLRDLRGGRVVESLLALQDEGDRGDLYTASLRGEARTAPLGAPRLVARGPLRGSLALDASDSAGVALRAVLSLDAGAGFLRVTVHGENRAPDHRLRVVFATDVRDGETWADAAFGPVRREPVDATAEDRAIETPPPTAPLHRWVSLVAGSRGATIVSDGLAEYETFADGRIAVTLLRAVGELSRPDLPERPGHAGWPAPTPGAQSLGPFAACFGIALHGARDRSTIAAVERVAEDVLLPIRGATLRSALAVPDATRGIELEGEGLALSSCKPGEDDEWTVLRCVNLTDEMVAGRWRLGWTPREARRSRLDETPGEPLAVVGSVIELAAAPREVVTVLVR